MYPENFGQLAYDYSNKKNFLNKSAALLRTVAKGFPDLDCRVKKNEGGIAVGGDVYLYVNGVEKGVLVTITHSPISSQRADGVICYLQPRLPDRTGKFTVLPVNAPNRYVALDAQRIHAEVQRMLAA
ncbi:MAG: hypothetical protein M0003_13730 [Acidithiobacillus sp.]|nr:hypothetical protein [Acidithiobacillus sp.]